MADRIFTDKQEEVMLRLQQGIPIVPEPFKIIGEELGLREADIVDMLFDLFKQDKARRFGGVFDIRRLGYTSVLCAAIVPENDVDEVAKNIIPFRGVTHYYIRTCSKDLGLAPPVRADGLIMPNVWFTLSLSGESFDDGLKRVRNAVMPYEFTALPAVKRFKVDVIMDLRQGKTAEHVPSLAVTNTGAPVWDGSVRFFSPDEKRVIRSLSNLPITARPFDTVAGDSGYAPEEFYGMLGKWKSEGILKRVALVIKHRNAGFNANGMCVWRVSSGEAAGAGRKLAARSEVTHCYERACTEDFPYNLYAMIHTDTIEATLALFGELSGYAGLKNGLVFISTKEYKKTSMELFHEEEKYE